MENNQGIPTQLIEQFLKGKISDSEEKELLEWIDKTPNSFVIFQNEQERLRPIIAKQANEEVNFQWKLLLNKIQDKTKTKRFNSTRVYFSAVAAVLLTALILGVVFKSEISKRFFAEKITEVVTSCGEKTSFILSDGTRVQLNAGSKLIFPEKFKGDTREVKLIGEAFFEVTPDKMNPFIVKTQELNIRVLGTAFNVEAFPDAAEVNTTLVHGKVALERETSVNTVILAEMNPFEHAVYKTKKQEINVQQEINIDQYISWKDGKLVFMNASVQEVAKKLELWFNVSVQVKGEKLRNAHFTGTFTNETIDQVLKLLKISYPIEYTIQRLDAKGNTNLPLYNIVLSSNE